MNQLWIYILNSFPIDVQVDFKKEAILIRIVLLEIIQNQIQMMEDLRGKDERIKIQGM